MWKLPLSELDYDVREEQAVAEVLASRWLSMGPQTAAFEAEFAAAHARSGIEDGAFAAPGAVADPAPGTTLQAVAVSSGTAALQLALRAVGVGPGGEVILPSLTFVATAHAVLQCGGVPVMADVTSAASPLLDPADVERRITPATVALLPVHYGGALCDMSALSALARRHGLAVVEDAAHAAGTPGVGQLSDAAAFSFYANKNLATGEGGMVLTSREDVRDACVSLRSHGRAVSSLQKADGDTTPDDVTAHGINARLTEMQAALGRVQLQKLASGNARRRELRAVYAEALEGAVDIPLLGREQESACHLMVVLLPEAADREAVRAALAADGIQTSVHYPPIHRLSAFAHLRGEGGASGSWPVTDALAPRLLTLPLYPRLTGAQAQHVAKTLRDALARRSDRSRRPRSSHVPQAGVTRMTGDRS